MTPTSVWILKESKVNIITLYTNIKLLDIIFERRGSRGYNSDCINLSTIRQTMLEKKMLSWFSIAEYWFFSYYL